MPDSKNSHKSSRSKKKNKRLKRQLLILIFVLIILGLGYYYMNYYTKENVYYTTSNNPYIEYTIVDNPDSIKYQAAVIYNKNIDINTIASTFYKSDLFWPYIYIENKEIINNPLDIEKDMVLRIPRLSDSLINLKNSANIDHVKQLADSILENIVVKYDVNTLMRTN